MNKLLLLAAAAAVALFATRSGKEVSPAGAPDNNGDLKKIDNLGTHLILATSSGGRYLISQPSFLPSKELDLLWRVMNGLLNVYNLGEEQANWDRMLVEYGQKWD